jgi:4-hydroxy-2-oxoheptanedioate aldolase
MPAPFNPFKAALANRKPQTGLWIGLANPLVAELCAYHNFDWLVVDGEHAPNDLPLIALQLKAIASAGGTAVVRPPMGEPWMLKQLLDAGAQSLIVPMVDTAEQAAALVRAVRYPPEGIRGVGAGLASASQFNQIADYLTTANDQICLVVQAETRTAMENLPDICDTEGVDGVFFGPADLAADMGLLGKPGAADVVSVVERGIRTVVKSGKPAGVLTPDLTLARRYASAGATFIAIGSDVSILSAGLQSVRSRFEDSAC